MRVDALTLRAVAGELQRDLAGARIDVVIAPTPQAIALQCYGLGQNRWLLLSAHPQLARVHLLPGKPQKLVAEPSTFVMLLRKYVESGRILRVAALPWERVVVFDIHGHEGDVALIVEVMGNISNIILVTAQRVVLGALHQFGHSVNRYRTILPGQPYVTPPPQTRTLNAATLPRLEPAAVTGFDLAQAAVEAEQSGASMPPAARIVLTQVAGMSQDTAQEIVCRATGEAQTTIGNDVTQWDAVAAQIRALAQRAAQETWEPVAILNDAGQLTDGALWPPCVKPERPQRPMPSVNALLAAYFAAREWGEAIGGASADLRRALKTAHDRQRKKLAALQAELAALQEAERLRHEGEMLLAFASEIPDGATTFATPDLGDGQPSAAITLDPRLTAVENANARFTRYHKMRRAALQIPEQIARTEVDLARVAQLQTDLDLAETLGDIAHVRAEIAAARLNRGEREEVNPKKKKAPGKGNLKSKGSVKARAGGEPLRFTSSDGFTIWVGKNSQQNEHVTFDIATGSDIWLHARGVPGAHVIVKSAGRPAPSSTLNEAAALAAWYSGSRTAGSVPVDYTEQRYVRHMKDGGPGMVIYVKEKTIPATPKDLAEQRVAGR